MIRSLFCLANASISGGNKAILEYARGLKERAQVADIYVWHGDRNLNWFDDTLRVIDDGGIESVVSRDYDMVFFVKAFLVPLALPHVGRAKPVLICHDFESAYVATTFDAITLDCPAFDDVLRLPIDIITTSKPVQEIIGQRLNKVAYFVPLAIDKSMFQPVPVAKVQGDPLTKVQGAPVTKVQGAPVTKVQGEPLTKVQGAPVTKVQRARKRVLMVGDHLLPTKGIRDGLKALQLLADELPVELVLITREERGKQIFADLGYPCEIHVRPDPKEVQNIYAGCDVYCCTSWYEGFGLPALEAFRVGIPVVSTRNSGVSNYGLDGENLLLCAPNDPVDLSQKLSSILKNEELRTKLIENGRKTEEQYDWTRALDELVLRQKEILSDPRCRVQVGEDRIPVSKDRIPVSKVQIPVTEDCLPVCDDRISDSEDRVSVSADRIQQIINNLEENGLYTPHSVHDHCRQLFERIDETLKGLTENGIEVASGLATLSRLRTDLRTYLSKPGAEYYKTCKKRYDLCQLVISLGDDSRFLQHLSKLVAQLNRNEAESLSGMLPVRERVRSVST